MENVLKKFTVIQKKPTRNVLTNNNYITMLFQKKINKKQKKDM